MIKNMFSCLIFYNPTISPRAEMIVQSVFNLPMSRSLYLQISELVIFIQLLKADESLNRY
jgi:hypothetical protein